MSSFPIHNMDGKKIEDFDLPEKILEGPVNRSILHQAILMYQANKRQGTASTKERGQVSGGGKKPYRQKGTGRARAGSIRSPLWRGGGTVFGPSPRDFGYEVPKKIKSVALRESLKAKLSTNDVFCVDRITLKSTKTKDFAKILKKLKMEGRILALSDEYDKDLLRVAKNIRLLSLLQAQEANAYDILRNKKILITKPAFKTLLKRIK
ncbi:MAG: 50S ribosomal protein L4 [Candidatus Omnitrophota bacterium]